MSVVLLLQVIEKSDSYLGKVYSFGRREQHNFIKNCAIVGGQICEGAQFSYMDKEKGISKGYQFKTAYTCQVLQNVLCGVVAPRRCALLDEVAPVHRVDQTAHRPPPIRRMSLSLSVWFQHLEQNRAR